MLTGPGVVSHAGTALLSEMADRVGLTAAFCQATDRLRVRRSGHDPGRVLVDVAIADGAETITDVQALRAQARQRAWAARGELTGT